MAVVASFPWLRHKPGNRVLCLQLVGPLGLACGQEQGTSKSNLARETASPSAAKPIPIKSRTASAAGRSPVSALITKVDRMKTRQGEPLFLKVDVGGETVRVFGRPEELAELGSERLRRSNE